MILERIVTLANEHSKVRFLAMERSLRATGCTLPLYVIPYDDNKFELPENATWWEMPEITGWIDKNKLWPAFRKIQCLTLPNYQFVDSDVIFFKNPEDTLEPLSGFITSCTHWMAPEHTFTDETLRYIKAKTTTWTRLVFNSGQFACDKVLYQADELMRFCETNFTETLFHKNYLYKDQPGINILVNCADVEISNVTMPPVSMASTWAGDYTDEASFERFEKHDKPYFIHWAGVPLTSRNYIHQYFFKFLTAEENAAFKLEGVKKLKFKDRMRIKIKAILNILNN
ncbi:hypothetical protein [Mucilaginibacter aquatilis]|uniref:Glycosyl transferase n=1 Tax=Mucilaginibacter aquatilis TaxID=1517760 RepID=A0A6I4IC35_9SPHI|nr:hypothetical protein [Mucilaginibacter aquatilis]MVN92781.1 hypothetical protein [Mucilaginibacter aquatilis]